MRYLVIFLVLLALPVIIPTAFGNCISLPCDDSGIKLGEPNYRFIDFSYANTFEDSIKFILERTAYGNCNSYEAQITDENGNLVWGEGAEPLCAQNKNPILVTSQIKIGYNEKHPIIITESGKYFIKVQIDGGSIEQEFVVRQNHSGGSLDRTVYPIPFDMPSPHKQMKLGIKLGHIICDKDKYPVWNIHYKPACVYPDTESELLTRGWAKLRLMLPASSDPIKELEITGQNEFSYRVMGNLVYGDEKYPLSDDRKREIALEYSQQYHPKENYLEYAITSHEKHHDVGDKIQFDLLEWGNYQNCWNLKLQILDIYDHAVYEDNSVKYCLEPDDALGTFHSYSMGNEFDEFVCKNPGYYRIEVSNEMIYPSKILENFVCMEPENEN